MGLVPNAAGGINYEADCWYRAERYLMLGFDGSTYYANKPAQHDLAVRSIRECLAKDGPRLVQLAADISVQGRCIRNDSCLIALALALASPDLATRQAVEQVFTRVVRTGAHLLLMAALTDTATGWGRLKGRCFRGWYHTRDDVEFQILKYLQRVTAAGNRWHQRDVMFLCNPRIDNTALVDFLFDREVSNPSPLLQDYLDLRSGGDAAEIAQRGRISWEMVPSEQRTPDFWRVAVHRLPPEAMLRSLSVLSMRGLLPELTGVIFERMTADRCEAARLHPMKLLHGLYTYQAGCGQRSSNTWRVDQDVCEHLFDTVETMLSKIQPTQQQLAIAIDISSSMQTAAVGDVATYTTGRSPVSCSAVAAGLALFLARACQDPILLDFHATANHALLSPEMSLRQVLQAYSRLPGGSTDCAAPARWILEHGENPAGVVVLSDGETCNRVDQLQTAMWDLRKARMAPTKLLGVDIVPGFSRMTDPNDPLSTYCIGYDTGTIDVVLHSI